MITRYTLTVAVCFVLFLGISTSADARSNLMREVTFEKGWNGTNKDTDTLSSINIVSSKSRSGGKSVLADRKQGTNRSEVSDRIKGRAPLHKRVMYGWSLRVDANNNNNGNRRLIVSQIHHHQAENRPNQWSQTANFIIRHDASTNTFTLKHGYQSSPKRRKDNYVDLGTAKYGQWYDFVVEAKWTWRSDGFVRVWMNGKEVYKKTGSTYFDYGSKTKGPYWKAGAYTDKRPAEVYVDEYRMGGAGATYADVDPAGKDKPEPPPPSEPLPALKVVDVTWGETGTNHVGIELATVDPDADPQLDKRTYKEGSVTFWSIDRSGLTIHRQAPTFGGRPDGWTFYLDKPTPDADIRILALPGWLDGAPGIDQIIPRWVNEPEPLPIINLDQGQKASCLGEMTLSEASGAFPGTLTYSQCKESN